MLLVRSHHDHALEHGYNHSFAAFFVVDNPGSNGTQYTNNAAYAITWQKGANDNIFGFDLEMTRMSVNGLYLIARNGEYVDYTIFS